MRASPSLTTSPVGVTTPEEHTQGMIWLIDLLLYIVGSSFIIYAYPTTVELDQGLGMTWSPTVLILAISQCGVLVDQRTTTHLATLAGSNG